MSAADISANGRGPKGPAAPALTTMSSPPHRCTVRSTTARIAAWSPASAASKAAPGAGAVRAGAEDDAHPAAPLPGAFDHAPRRGVVARLGGLEGCAGGDGVQAC